MGEAQGPVQKKTHVQVRRETAAELAKKTPVEGLILALEQFQDPEGNFPEKTGEWEVAKQALEAAKAFDQTDFIEQILLMAEKRGVNASLEFLTAYINTLANGMARGVANHVNQAAMRLHQWFKGSPNFITAAEEANLKEQGLLEPSKLVKPSRAFIGMVKDDQKG